MKKDLLIKKIASEFNVDEVSVSEYFDNIFETLASAFIKNKNVNISEFGKFKVKTKKDEEGEKQKTVLFSPVKKFADDINYNFNELLPVQIRLLDSGVVAPGSTEEYEDDIIEEILLIDFEEETAIEKEETLIPEPERQETPTLEVEKKEEVLIPESETQETPTLEAEKKEEVLIPEEEKSEIPTLEEEKEKEVLIHEAPAPEIFSENIPEEIKEEPKKERKEVIEDEEIELGEDRERILEVIGKIKFPEKTFVYLPLEAKQKNILSAAKIIAKDTTIYIKQEKTEEVKTNKERIDDEIEKLKAFIIDDTEPEIKEEPVKEEPLKEETVTEETNEINTAETPEDNIKEIQDIFIEESKEELPEEITPEVTEIKDTETLKTSLELESELLQMLEERKKILEEISKLENSKDDDVIDIEGPKTNGDEVKPKLFDESTLDRPKQNVFSKEEGKVFEDLLNLISGDETPKVGSQKEEEKIPEIQNEIREEVPTEIKEEKKPNEEIFSSNTDFRNFEMSVFDKLLDEPEKTPVEKHESVSPEIAPEQDSELTSFSDLEKMFRSFKTEITDVEPVEVKPVTEEPAAIEPIAEKSETVIPEKTEAIKTYDDIFNLIGPNGDNKEEKPVEKPVEPPEKKINSKTRIAIAISVLISIILLLVFLYEKLVYKPSESSMELPVTQPVDSTKTTGNETVVFADTNKVTEQESDEEVFEKDGKTIRESSRGFFIEYGEFENQFVLAREIKVLKDKNITPGYEEVKEEGKSYYKMKLGPYNSLKEAKLILSKL